VVKKRFAKATTFKKRQLYVQMMSGSLMMQKDIFEKYFKLDFLAMVNDRVPNVRISVAKALRHHFIKEIQGTFTEDAEFNNAIRVLKLDTCGDVRYQVEDIEL